MNKFILPDNDTYVRVNKVIGKKRGSIKKLSRILDYERKTVADKLNGYRQFTQNDIIRICEHYHCSADYLLFGKETKMNKTDKPVVILLEERIEEACGQICDHYCKWPAEYKDQDRMMEEKCENCPLANL